MSVEDAKVAFADAIDDACTERDHDLLGRAIASDERVTDAIDRLILEVQAEEPCVRAWEPRHRHTAFAAVSGWRDCINRPRFCPECGHKIDACPSCTARMKLKETADAR